MSNYISPKPSLKLYFTSLLTNYILPQNRTHKLGISPRTHKVSYFTSYLQIIFHLVLTNYISPRTHKLYFTSYSYSQIIFHLVLTNYISPRTYKLYFTSYLQIIFHLVLTNYISPRTHKLYFTSYS